MKTQLTEAKRLRDKNFYLLMFATYFFLLIGCKTTQRHVPDSGSITLVRDSQPEAVIVLSKQPTRSAQLAAAELQYHIKLISGAELPIHKGIGDVPSGKYPIYVGESEFTKKIGLTNNSFKKQENLVKVTDDYTVLIGHDNPDYGEISYKKNGAWPDFKLNDPNLEVGTLYATYEFLERLCGVRWYMITDLGTVYPKTINIKIFPYEKRMQPWTASRIIGRGNWAKPGTFGRPDAMGYVRNRNYSPLRDRILYALRNRYRQGDYNFSGHGLHGYDKKYGKTHPDWFVGGKPGPNIQLRFWRDEVVDEVAKNIIDYFNLPEAERKKQLPGFIDVYAIGPNDNRLFGKNCVPQLQPERKRKGTFADGKVSNYWFTFVNKVAKKVRKVHPDKWLAVPAYASHFEPPDFELEPNIAIHMCNTEGWEKDSYGMKNLENWGKKVNRTFLYDYWYSRGRFPLIRPYEVAAYCQRLRDAGIEGFFMELINNSNSSLYHLDNYITMRMLFDSEADVDNLVEEYYSLFYGPAAIPMKKFWTVMAEKYKNVPKRGDRDKIWAEIGETGFMDTLDTYLKEAESLAKEEPYLSRIKVIRKGAIGMMQERIGKGKHSYTGNKRLICPSIKNPPELNGIIDEDIWKSAAPSTPFVTSSNLPSNTITTVKTFRDNQNLYFAFKCLKVPFNKKWQVQIALDVHRTRQTFYLFTFNSQGKTTNLKITAYRGKTWRKCNRIVKTDRVNWKSEAKAVVKKQADGFTAEVRVPLKKLDTDPLKPADVWGANFAVMLSETSKKKAPPEISMWSPTFESFYFPDHFGILVMRQQLQGTEPVLHYDFEGDFIKSKKVKDVSGVQVENNHLYSPGICTKTRKGKPWSIKNIGKGISGQSLVFYGKDAGQYVKADICPGINLRNDDFTISFWYKANQMDGLLLASLVNTRGTNSSWYFASRSIKKSGLIQFILSSKISKDKKRSQAGVSSKDAFEIIKDKKWHHFMLMIDRGKNARLYVDKKLIGKSKISNVKVPLENLLSISTYYNSFSGEIDELKVFQGTFSQKMVDNEFKSVTKQ